MKKLILIIVLVGLSVGVVEASGVTETDKMIDEATRASIDFVTNNENNLLLWSMIMVLKKDGDEKFIRECIMDDVELFMSKRYDSSTLDRGGVVSDMIYDKIMSACHFFACGQQQGFNTMIAIDNNLKASILEGIPIFFIFFLRAQLEKKNVQ